MHTIIGFVSPSPPPPCMTRVAPVFVTPCLLSTSQQAFPRSLALYPRLTPTAQVDRLASSFLSSPSSRPRDCTQLRPHPLLFATRVMASSATSSSPSPFSPDPSIKAEKAALRKSITARLRALDDTHVTAEASRLFLRLLELEAVQRSECLSLYLSMPSKEVPTFPVLLTALMEGGEQEGDAEGAGGKARRKKQVYVPKVIGPASADMVMLPLSSPQDIATFPLSKWGIPEPVLPPSLPPSLPPLDLVIIPGLAFDANCNRLGHGKGYYDCFLSRLLASHAKEGRQRPYMIGLALDEQIIESVPLDAFDLPLEAVVTPSGVYLRK